MDDLTAVAVIAGLFLLAWLFAVAAERLRGP
jgi:hypothetical protein